MNAPDALGMVVAGVAIVSALLAGIIWLIRAQVAMQREFKPNGGASTRDALNRIEAKVDKHIDWHMDRAD